MSAPEWLSVAAMAAIETAFALTMFVPAYAVAALIMAARRRQLEREQLDSVRWRPDRSLRT